MPPVASDGTPVTARAMPDIVRSRSNEIQIPCHLTPLFRRPGTREEAVCARDATEEKYSPRKGVTATRPDPVAAETSSVATTKQGPREGERASGPDKRQPPAGEPASEHHRLGAKAGVPAAQARATTGKCPLIDGHPSPTTSVTEIGEDILHRTASAAPPANKPAASAEEPSIARNGKEVGGAKQVRKARATQGGYETRQSFEDRLEALRAFKAKYGHVNVQYKRDSSLYHFCFRLKKAGATLEKMSLDAKRIDSLDALGFDWGPGLDIRQ